MGFELKYRETSPGSFAAWGIGLQYNYNKNVNALNVTPRERSEALVQYHFDTLLSEDPLGYIFALEKASQIKALMYSQNRTLDITQTIADDKLKPIVDNAARLSRYAYDLKNNHFERFCLLFADEFEFKKIKIKHFVSDSHTNTFFIARIQTEYDNSVCVRACTLAGVTAALSDRTLRDLVTMEFGHKFGTSAHRLLQASTKFASLSSILDDAFVPERKLKLPTQQDLDTSASIYNH